MEGVERKVLERGNVVGRDKHWQRWQRAVATVVTSSGDERRQQEVAEVVTSAGNRRWQQW